jgi:hypothetical protein
MKLCINAALVNYPRRGGAPKALPTLSPFSTEPFLDGTRYEAVEPLPGVSQTTHLRNIYSAGTEICVFVKNSIVKLNGNFTLTYFVGVNVRITAKICVFFHGIPAY